MKTLIKNILSIPNQVKKWHIEMALVSGLLASCSGGSGEKLLGYQEIEKKVYDIPMLSRLTYRAYLTEPKYTDEELTKLVNKLISDYKYEPMKFHQYPTQLYVFIYDKKGDCEADGSNWVAMYDESGLQIKHKQ